MIMVPNTGHPLRELMMSSPLASHTLLLAVDSRQTALAASARARLDRTAYNAYGHQGKKPAFRIGFNGQLRERLGWYHLGNGHRVYNPVLMRFHSADQLSPFDKGGLNPYAYCVGDPINHNDPTGRFFEWLAGNPLHSLGLNGSLLVANYLASILVKPVGLALWSARLSMTGSIVGTVGAVAQLSGVKEGRDISIVGSLASMAGATLRAALSIQSLYAKRGTLGNLFYEGTRNLLLGPRKVVRPASIALEVPRTPVVAPTVVPTVAPVSRASSISGTVSSGASTGTTVRPVSPVAPSDMTSMHTPLPLSTETSRASSPFMGSVPSVVRQKVESFNVRDWLSMQP